MLFGAGGVTRTPDLWLLVRMHTGDLLMIFRHSQRLLCNSILHNHALVDIYLVKENCTIELLVRIGVCGSGGYIKLMLKIIASTYVLR